MALGRTVMANERTALSFLWTAIGLAGAGAGILKLWDHPGLDGLAFFFLTASVLMLALGWVGYWTRRKSFVAIADYHHKGR
jgi:uncharacterized membrane protein YidH (DUF202 family)